MKYNQIICLDILTCFERESKCFKFLVCLTLLNVINVCTFAAQYETRSFVKGRNTSGKCSRVIAQSNSIAPSAVRKVTQRRVNANSEVTLGIRSQGEFTANLVSDDILLVRVLGS